MPRADRLLEAGFLVCAAGFLIGGFGLPTVRWSELTPGPRPAGHLRVVSWNLGRSGTESGGHPRGLSNEHLPAIATTLRELDADLVCVQEVRSRAQMSELERLLGRTGWTSLVGAHGIGVLAQRGGLSRIDAEGTPGLCFEFRPRAHEPLVGLVLHADAFSARARNEAIGHATESLLAAAAGRPCLLIGDLNLDLDLDKRRDLFTDDEYLDVETYNFVAQRLDDTTLGTGPTAEPDRRLDYVFASTDFDTTRSGPWRGRRTGDMDHDPVVVHLRY